MAPDLSSETTGGMSGGTMGGSRESDVGGGLSGGMRSGMGDDASGGRGGGVGGRQRIVEAEKAVARDQTAHADRRRRGKTSKTD
jgi:hypothetical protein